MQVTVCSPKIYTYGAMLIGGIIQNMGYEVSIQRDIRAIHGDVLFLSLYSTQHLISPEIKDAIKNLQAHGTKCYIGGPVSAYPDIVFGELNPDAVVTGEGEPAIPVLLETGDPKKAPNCAYRVDNTIITTEKVRITDIEHPLPLIPDDIRDQSIRGANVYIETHRGCFGRCGFCQVPLFFGRTIRSREITPILKEVAAFKEKGVNRVAISGGTGSLYKSHDNIINTDAFIELLKGLSKIMGPKNVSCPDIRVDCITNEVLEAIRTYTIGWLFFGIESGSQKMLDSIRKGITIEQAEAAVTRCRQFDVKVAGSLICGYPDETEEDFRMTKEFLTANTLDDVFVSIAEPIPHTALARSVLETGLDENPVFAPHHGEYASLHLTEAEARAFDLMLHADMCKPVLHLVTDDTFSAYLQEARRQGSDIRAVTDLLRRYHGNDIQNKIVS